jgi:CheY-like chemotaxis protein
MTFALMTESVSASSGSGTQIQPTRIMIVDDDREGSEPLSRLLQRAGYEVHLVTDSRHALQSAIEFQPHAVILDFLMPELHGGDVAWQLASSPRLQNVKVIVASAYPKEEIQRALPPTKIPIMPKPIDMEELLRLLAEKTS